MKKPISFRPTPKISKYVDSQQQKHPKKKPSHIIIEMLELAISRSGQEGKSSLPTGIILQCPARSFSLGTFLKSAYGTICVPKGVYWKPPVDSSVCKTCSKYPCETWEWILSGKRCFPNNPLLKMVEEHHNLTKLLTRK